MKTSIDEFTRGGGGSPPSAGFTSYALPSVQTVQETQNRQRGVSTNYGQPTTIRLGWEFTKSKK